MRNLKIFGALLAVIALSAIGAGAAAAHTPATFTASEAGELTGEATETQEFTTDAGVVRCKKADSSGTIASPASTSQTVTVTYTECTAFGGFVPVHDIMASYNFTANGEVHIEETITIVVTTGFGSKCHVTVKPQTVKSVDYTNINSMITVTPTVTGIHYVGSGGLCGSETKTNGTYKGKNTVSRVGGGSISWDATVA